MSAGTAARESIAIIQAAGATPHAVAIALDRQEMAVENGVDVKHSAVQYVRDSLGLQVCAIAKLADLLQYLKEHSGEGLAAYHEQVLAYRERYGWNRMTRASLSSYSRLNFRFVGKRRATHGDGHTSSGTARGESVLGAPASIVIRRASDMGTSDSRTRSLPSHRCQRPHRTVNREWPRSTSRPRPTSPTLYQTSVGRATSLSWSSEPAEPRRVDLSRATTGGQYMGLDWPAAWSIGRTRGSMGNGVLRADDAESQLVSHPRRARGHRTATQACLRAELRLPCSAGSATTSHMDAGSGPA
jgi:hypothetical protein